MFLKLMIFFLFFAVNSWAQSGQRILAGFDPQTDIIADNYEAGPYLIYDCEEKHWTCVMESYFQDCERKRSEDRLSGKINLRCAPIGSFPVKKSCFQRSLFLTSQNYGTRFCINNTWREKEVEFLR